MSNIIEGEDFYYNEDGLMVLTSAYHLKRAVCCGSGCLHCPYNYEKVSSAKRKELLKQRPPVIMMNKQNK
jgi:Family of unknown function (DUF5522)